MNTESVIATICLGLLTFCCFYTGLQNRIYLWPSGHFLIILRWLNSFKNMVLGGPIQSEVNYSLLNISDFKLR